MGKYVDGELFKNSEAIENFERIEINYPNGWANCGITTDNFFIADTNDSTNWNSLKFPLPKPKYQWKIEGYKGEFGHDYNKQFVVLIDCP